MLASIITNLTRNLLNCIVKLRLRGAGAYFSSTVTLLIFPLKAKRPRSK